MVSLLRWWSSESSYHGFYSWARQGEGPLFISSESTLVQTCQFLSFFLGTKQALRSLCILKINWAPFKKGRPNGLWHGNTRIMHNSSTIFNMIILATPNKRRSWWNQNLNTGWKYWFLWSATMWPFSCIHPYNEGRWSIYRDRGRLLMGRKSADVQICQFGSLSVCIVQLRLLGSSYPAIAIACVGFTFISTVEQACSWLYHAHSTDLVWLLQVFLVGAGQLRQTRSLGKSQEG